MTLGSIYSAFFVGGASSVSSGVVARICEAALRKHAKVVLVVGGTKQSGIIDSMRVKYGDRVMITAVNIDLQDATSITNAQQYIHQNVGFLDAVVLNHAECSALHAVSADRYFVGHFNATVMLCDTFIRYLKPEGKLIILVIAHVVSTFQKLSLKLQKCFATSRLTRELFHSLGYRYAEACRTGQYEKDGWTDDYVSVAQLFDVIYIGMISRHREGFPNSKISCLAIAPVTLPHLFSIKQVNDTCDQIVTCLMNPFQNTERVNGRLIIGDHTVPLSSNFDELKTLMTHADQLNYDMSYTEYLTNPLQDDVSEYSSIVPEAATRYKLRSGSETSNYSQRSSSTSKVSETNVEPKTEAHLPNDTTIEPNPMPTSGHVTESSINLHRSNQPVVSRSVDVAVSNDASIQCGVRARVTSHHSNSTHKNLSNRMLHSAFEAKTTGSIDVSSVRETHAESAILVDAQQFSMPVLEVPFNHNDTEPVAQVLHNDKDSNNQIPVSPSNTKILPTSSSMDRVDNPSAWNYNLSTTVAPSPLAPMVHSGLPNLPTALLRNNPSYSKTMGPNGLDQFDRIHDEILPSNRETPNIKASSSPIKYAGFENTQVITNNKPMESINITGMESVPEQSPLMKDFKIMIDKTSSRLSDGKEMLNSARQQERTSMLIPQSSNVMESPHTYSNLMITLVQSRIGAVVESKYECKKNDEDSDPSLLQPNEVLLRLLYLSVDSTHRSTDDFNNSKSTPTVVTNVVSSEAIGEVLFSKNPNFFVGDRIRDTLPWKSIMKHTPSQKAIRIADGAYDPALLHNYLTYLGTTGRSAFVGYSLLKLKKGDTLLVGAASGGIGQVVCQLALKDGIKIIAVASNEQESVALHKAGVVNVVKRSNTIVPEHYSNDITRLTDVGLDAAFEVVGGWPLDVVFEVIKTGGRVVLCGDYINSQALPSYCTNSLSKLVEKDLTVVGYKLKNTTIDEIKFQNTIAQLDLFKTYSMLLKVGTLSMAISLLMDSYNTESQGTVVLKINQC